MALLVHLVALLADYKIPVLLLLFLAACFLPAKSLKVRKIRMAAMLCLGLANLAGGPFLRNWLIYRVGEPAVGKVVDTYRPTGQNYRGNVIGYKVMLRSASGQIAESRYRSDSLFSYPQSLVKPPAGDDVFNVRYLPGFPQDMVLVTNDNSPWVVRERCAGLMYPLQQAKAKFNFAAGAAPYRQPFIAAIDAYLQQGCGSAEMRRDYAELRSRLGSGQLQQAP